MVDPFSDYMRPKTNFRALANGCFDWSLQKDHVCREIRLDPKLPKNRVLSEWLTSAWNLSHGQKFGLLWEDPIHIIHESEQSSSIPNLPFT